MKSKGELTSFYNREDDARGISPQMPLRERADSGVLQNSQVFIFGGVLYFPV